MSDDQTWNDELREDLRETLRGVVLGESRLAQSDREGILTDCDRLGWFALDDANVEPKTYEANALGIAHEVCDCLRENGLEPEWDGDISRKIRLSLNWQRRNTLS